ncbi:TlpA family protein disulfide reductase [Natronomonas marina]|uniref:TlpA family protein disulfide reductase n=1 Tax=Natronomonas marina TaxID=2961939 RepID=UPI0020C9404D|nr:thioredoxin family protein [Natronomonas marina]
MERSELVDRLLDDGVLSADGDGITVTEPFRRDYEGYVSAARNGGSDPSAEPLGSELPASLADVASSDPEFVASFLALRDRTELGHEELLRLAPVVDRFTGRPEPSDALPEGFLPVDCQRLLTLVELYRRTIVYAWREDCPPCDAMKESLEAVDIPDSVARLAVYGPDCATVLREEFDAAVAPTTLYTLNGRVEVRHVGPQGEKALETELREFLKTPR